MPEPANRRLPLTRLLLDNGLRVVLQPDHEAPIVAVNLWYHVGSKHELPGRTGFAHLFEHMLFQGSENVPLDQHFALIQQRGGVANGSTWFDRTNYYETLPARELELALWLESDRMGFLEGGLSQDKLDNQRDVVKNERRQRVDNQPYGTWLERGMALLFPPGHPYHWPVIGYMEDLDAASLTDVQDFFRTHYRPNNAVLSIVGDIDLPAAEALVRRYFEDIPRGPEREPVNARFVTPGHEITATVEDDVPLPRLHALYAIPPYGDAGYYALDLATDLLSSGKSTRLYRHLVHERELAQDISAFTFNTEEAGVLGVIGTPRPGVSLETLRDAIDHEIERLRVDPVPEVEMARTRNRIETSFVRQQEAAEPRADHISMYTTYFDEPERLETEIERYRAVTPQAVQAAAHTFLGRDQRVLVSYLPRRVQSQVTVGALPAPLERSRTPPSGHERPYHLPRPERHTLANGLRVVVARVARVPAAAALALMDAGAARDPQDRAGLATLTAALLDEGTTKLSAMEMAESLEALGATLASSSGVDSASLSVSALARHLPDAWAIAADALTNSAFPEREALRLKNEHLTQVLQDRSNPASLADDLFERLLYPDHPYGRSVLGDEQSLPLLGADDARRFAATHMRPETTTIIVAGDVDPATILAMAERTLGSWARGTAPIPTLPVVPDASGGRRLYLIDRPGATQSEIRAGNLGISRTSTDWVTASVMNSILGGKFTSRINLNLRQRHGYTYGAHSSFEPRRGRGPFLVSTAVQSESTAPALSEILSELKRIRDEAVLPEELADTRSYLQGVFPLTVETSGHVLRRLAEIELYRLPDDEFDRYRDRVGAVDAAAILRVAQAHVRPEDLVVLVVGPAAEIRAGLELLGPLTLLDDRGHPIV